MSETSPTARALRTLDLLAAHPGLTATDLGERLGVTERAARRYVAILREAGIPVESTRGPYGGYRLGRGLRLPPLVFTTTEALGLVMAALEGQQATGSAAPDEQDPASTALTKLLRALPEAVARPAAQVRAHAAATPRRTTSRPAQETTTALVAAVAAHRRVTVRYRSAAAREWTAEVDPWAVVVRQGHWYLLCRDLRADEQSGDGVRTYRLDRIGAVAETGKTFAPPADLDPVAVLEDRLGSGWAYETRVRFTAPPAAVAPYLRGPMGRLVPDGDGALLVGTTGNPRMYAGEWLAGIEIPYVVEGGPELRAAVAEVAAALESSLGSSPASSPAASYGTAP